MSTHLIERGSTGAQVLYVSAEHPGVARIELVSVQAGTSETCEVVGGRTFRWTSFVLIRLTEAFVADRA